MAYGKINARLHTDICNTAIVIAPAGNFKRLEAPPAGKFKRLEAPPAGKFKRL